MAHLGIGDDEAYQLLCAQSMKQRFSIENLSKLIASNGESEWNRLAIRNIGRVAPSKSSLGAVAPPTLGATTAGKS